MIVDTTVYFMGWGNWTVICH